MVHSNNAARVRLWMALKRPGGMGGLVDTTVVQYPDLQSDQFATVNPLKKVPALIRGDGTCVFESNVILSYLEDKFHDAGRSMLPATPEGRQDMELLCRIHDLYIASPNITQPGYCHTQGAMYLSTGWHGAVRGMDLRTRADKIAEIYKQLSWLEAQVAAAGSGPFLLGDSQLTLADLTWFPTFVFMEFMLPRIFGWPEIFQPDTAGNPFPRLAAWYTYCRAADGAFVSTHADIWGYWVEMEEAGQFKPIIDELSSPEAAGLKFAYGLGQQVMLNYQSPPPPGLRTGRYINHEDQGDVVDEHEPVRMRVRYPLSMSALSVQPGSVRLCWRLCWCAMSIFIQVPVLMRDAREICPPASLASHGFALSNSCTAVIDWRDEDHVRSVYYAEMRELVAQSLPAASSERVYVFDHTIRESGNTNLNAEAGMHELCNSWIVNIIGLIVYDCSLECDSGR
ncbi:glutathione S-transferase family protein [bacterium]|nr:glutathione S-transferase family protein [bacterium]